MQIEFPGKTVIVTGAAHGFGRALCIAFAERGAHVWGCDLLADELAETQALCVASGGTADLRVVDIRDRDAVMNFASEAAQTSGQTDILINNAGGVLGYV